MLLASGRFWVNNHAHVLQPLGGVPLQYVAGVLNTLSLAPYVTGTAQPKLTQAALNKIAVPIPPLSEQQDIVRLVDERLSQTDAAEKTIDAELIRSKKLRQGILKQAVDGRLITLLQKSHAGSPENA